MRPPAKVHQRISSSSNSMPGRSGAEHLAQDVTPLGEDGGGLGVR